MKVSVITVTYNSDKTLEYTLDSVLSQTYNEIELVIVDGGSTDNTISIIQKYETLFEMSSKSMIWISESDNGIYNAINKGISLSTGDIIGVLNSDDYYYSIDTISSIINEFCCSACDCVYGNLKYIDSNGIVRRIWKSRPFRKGLFEQSWSPAHPTFYVKRSKYIDLGFYKENYKIAADVELMYRFLEVNEIKSRFLDRFLVVMRQGGVSSRGLSSTYTITIEMIRAFKENGKDINIIKYIFYKFLKIREYRINSREYLQKL